MVVFGCGTTTGPWPWLGLGPWLGALAVGCGEAAGLPLLSASTVHCGLPVATGAVFTHAGVVIIGFDLAAGLSVRASGLLPEWLALAGVRAEPNVAAVITNLQAKSISGCAGKPEAK